MTLVFSQKGKILITSWMSESLQIHIKQLGCLLKSFSHGFFKFGVSSTPFLLAPQHRYQEYGWALTGPQGQSALCICGYRGQLHYTILYKGLEHPQIFGINGSWNQPLMALRDKSFFSPFYDWWIRHCTVIPHMLIHSSIGEHVGWFFFFFYE